LSVRTPVILGLKSLSEAPDHFSPRKSTRGIRFACSLFAIACLFVVSSLAAKQKPPTTQTVMGVVTDNGENQISGATVTLKDLQTGKTIAIYTEPDGQYRFSDLDMHHDYEIHAGYQGVDSETRTVSSFDTRPKIVINLTVATGENRDQAVADKLAALLNWEPGSVVADIGAGEGRLTLAAAERVGAGGHVFTTELDSRLLADLEGMAARQKVQNITVIKAAESQTNLPPQCCDSIFMRHVYHHLSKPGQEDASLFQALRPGGALAVIDFPPTEDASALEAGNEEIPANRSGHGITQQTLIDELTAAGFQVVTTATDWPGQDYCIVFRKPAH
jgi:ubiquinone/menaquinone biosynthesis C-methylase UbiE